VDGALARRRDENATGVSRCRCGGVVAGLKGRREDPGIERGSEGMQQLQAAADAPIGDLALR
jgi:hypothetical protein